MRVLVVTHYFPPEIGAPQARLGETTRYWAAAGEHVTVVTGMPNHPTGVVPEAYRGRVRADEEAGGCRVLRSWVYATPNEGVLKKSIGHLSFMVSSVLVNGARTGPVDVVVVSSPTFFSIFSAWLMARLRRARLVVEVRDLWPAIFVELGVLTDRRLIAVLEWFERWAYRAADAVVVVSDGFREDLIRRGVPPEKVHTIRNGVDLERFDPAAEPNSETRSRLGATEGEVLALYIGAHGISHGLDSVLLAAKRVEGDGVHVSLVGEGSARSSLLRQHEELALSNVTMLPGVPRDEVADLVAAADICLVPLRDVPLFSTFIPSKIFEFLGAGKAVIGAVTGESAGILRDAGAVVVPPQDDAALATAIRDLAASSSRRAELGRRGRAYVEQHFDRRQLADGYRALLQRVVG